MKIVIVDCCFFSILDNTFKKSRAREIVDEQLRQEEAKSQEAKK